MPPGELHGTLKEFRGMGDGNDGGESDGSSW